jgi:16S rRNA (guanine(966)-N(2))-methyltransferase RsmD
MRIISGSLRRRSIIVPLGLDVRPTTDRVREAVFNMLVGRVELVNARVLDLFAGSGALGFEAISRGASRATFIENNRRVAAVIRENARQFGVESSARVQAEDVAHFLKRYDGPPFDIVFADPPYTYASVDELPDRLIGLVADGGFLILEHDGRYHFGGHEALVVQRGYGRTRVSLFTPRHQEHDA